MNFNRLIQENLFIRETCDPDGPNADWIADTLNFALRTILISAKHNGKEKVHIQGIADMEPDEKQAMIEELSNENDLMEFD